MLLWIPTSPSAQTHGHLDDNEKGDKLRKRAAQARFRNILMVIGLFMLAFFATVSQVQYTQQRRAQPSLRIPGGRDRSEDLTPEQVAERAASAAKAKEDMNEEEIDEEPLTVDDFFEPNAHLPENSIYRLKLPDVTGNQVDMSQFAGMVSLVVNTACH